MTHKPFDREKALAGEPVVTRDGRKAIDLYWDFGAGSSDYPIIAMIDNEGYTYTENGIFEKNKISALDLFMESNIIMKSFDREKALNGEPVITGQGFDVTELHYFPSVKRIAGIINDAILTWGENGIWDDNGTPSKYDLFMKPKKITKWYNIYYNPNYKHIFFESYDTEEAALNDRGPYHLETHSIEIEE